MQALPTRSPRKSGFTGKGALAAIGATLALAGCAAPLPPGPTVLAVPPRNKPFDRFQAEDNYCRSVAYNQSGGQAGQQAAANSAVGSAAIGTALGAVAGGLIGSASGNLGTGAAIGAGSGLLLGSAVGAGNAGNTAGQVQSRYDMSYTQCMVAYGNTVQNSGPYPGYGPAGMPLVATGP